MNFGKEMKNYNHINAMLKNIDMADSQGSNACISKQTQQKTTDVEAEQLFADDDTNHVNIPAHSKLTLRTRNIKQGHGITKTSNETESARISTPSR